jgi:NADPH-dependent 2,4-dienoyl-CoA reductase/sulfur reductase-like enzyme
VRLVVIGGEAAGLSAAARARRLDPSLAITVLEKGGEISYGACGLPFLVDGRARSAEQLRVYSPEYFRKERNIEIRTNTGALAIAHARREVQIEGGGRVPYDRLVIATGARAAAGGIALHTLEDGERMKRLIDERKPRRALIIGAGYIGLELADALRRLGMRVTVVEESPYVLNREDEALAALVKAHLDRFGVELLLNTRSGGENTGDLVISATGLRPNVELAAEAGIELGRTGAIRVTDRMETNIPGIYAAGDCAETVHLVSGRPAWIPLGTTANKMGRVAGANAAGRRERFPGVVGTSIVGVCGLAIGLCGLSSPEARRAGFQPVSARVTAGGKARYLGGRPIHLELIADRGTSRLLGGTAAGEDGVHAAINTIATALHAAMRLEDVEHLDLAYAPPFGAVWDPVLVAAQQLRRQLG